jgi:ADP-L-glycero-D-manno-heptose 6-epimerase
MKSLIAQVWPRVREGKSVRLFKSHNPDYADGGQLRDFVYVRDAVDVIAWLLATPDVNGIYNLGSGRARSFEDLAKAVFTAAGQAPNIEYFDMPEGLRDRYQYFTQADMTRLTAAGYNQPFTALEDGVGDYVRRFLWVNDPYL